jgi:hypothetical protein
MSKHFIVILITVFSTLLLNAQNTATLTFPETMPTTGLRLSYLGSIKYPGAKIGLEYPIKVKEITKKRKEKVILKERFLAGNIGFFHHPDFHTNLMINAEWIMRRHRAKSPWYGEWSPGLGYAVKCKNDSFL